ncbi:hypothetical protein D8B22_21215 [Verminephrobacter aporrectodeae subsp. tuberculatae]|nr:hypothetical protein [Verminephrobacter aporrectodeae]MCW8163955.1 hypothetical protein [Verminephrobacter aporrectodeae subsp. tuberculatae]MCW8171545.1 hypothetical protein [Verminephrobacter aporrectodeae subsp. tuberculatae]
MGYPNNEGLITSSDGLPSITAAVVNNTGRIPGDSIAITGAGRGAVVASLFSNKLLALVLSCAVGMFPCGGGAANWRSEQSVALNGAAFVLTDATASANQSVAVTGTRIDATRARITSLGDVSVVASNGALHLGNAHLRAGQDLTATGTGAGTTAGMQALAGRDLTLGQGAHLNVVSLSLDKQLSAQLQHAVDEGLKYTLVVSPENKVISKELWKGILDVKGTVYQFNKETGVMTLISERPGK